MIKKNMTEKEIKNRIHYMLSKQILKDLKSDFIINNEQYNEIDKLNMESFVPDIYRFYNYKK